LVYPLGKQSHLNLSRASVPFLKLKVVYNVGLSFLVQTILLYSLTVLTKVKYNISYVNCKFMGAFLRLFINLTPLIPLSLRRRGGSVFGEGASPLKPPIDEQPYCQYSTPTKERRKRL